MKKVLVVGLLIVLLLVGWISAAGIGRGPSAEAQAQQYIQLAMEQESLGAYEIAIKSRARVLELLPTADNYLRLASTYYKAGRSTKYKSTLTSMISKFPGDSRGYEEMAKYYSANGAAEDCVKVVKQAASKGIRSTELDNLYYYNAFVFNNLGSGYDDAYHHYNGLAMVTINDKYFYVDDELEVVSKGYEDANSFLADIAGIKTTTGECYFINNGESKYMDSRHNIEEIDSFHENLALVKVDGKYRYITGKNQFVFGEYDQATLFSGGVAAVKEKDKWRIINTKGETVGNGKYAEVLIDEDNICSRQGRIFVKKKADSNYIMIDTAGNKVGKSEYVDARPFFNTGYTAVKVEVEEKAEKGKTDSKKEEVKKVLKWGFIATDGSTLIEPEYEDAKAFGSELAAVKVDGLWGFVTTKGRLVIEPQFEDAKSFTSSGIAPVKRDGFWGYIQLRVK